MFIFPYSTALTLAQPPWICYAAAARFLPVYTLQAGSPITASLLYYPDSWNPVNMVTAAFAHAGFRHLLQQASRGA